jgi:hypothetical protein
METRLLGVVKLLTYTQQTRNTRNTQHATRNTQHATNTRNNQHAARDKHQGWVMVYYFHEICEILARIHFGKILGQFHEIHYTKRTILPKDLPKSKISRNPTLTNTQHKKLKGRII